jgi:parallel beta-helix repeat protein
MVDNIIVDNIAGNDSWSAGIRLDSGLDTQIHSNIITGNNYGVLLYSSSPRVSIYNNTIAGNEFGIRVASGGSSYLNVSNNVVKNNRGYGIGVTGFGGGSNNATITRNLIVNNSDGVALGQYSNYNTISQNNISMNDCGLYIEYSTKNIVYSNNIVDNDQQVNITSPSTNAWDNGYPLGGNHWSAYSGTDMYKGSYQNETGSDGIGDTPVVFDGNNTDRYPLMAPWTEASGLVGDVNGDGRVDMKDVGYVARRFMCVPGDPLWDSNADFNSDEKINMVDIGTVARHFGESRS